MSQEDVNKEIIFLRTKHILENHPDYLIYFLGIPLSEFIKKDIDKHISDIEEYLNG